MKNQKNIKGKIEIKSEVSEKDMIEYLLNAYNSGFSQEKILLFLIIHAIAKRWKRDKLTYYLNLIKIEYDR